MTIENFAAKMNCSKKDAIEWLNKHDIKIFRGNIDLPPSLMSAICEVPVNRNVSGVGIGNIKSKNIINMDGYELERVDDISSFMIGDNVIYGESLCRVDGISDKEYTLATLITGTEIKVKKPQEGIKPPFRYARIIK